MFFNFPLRKCETIFLRKPRIANWINEDIRGYIFIKIKYPSILTLLNYFSKSYWKIFYYQQKIGRILFVDITLVIYIIKVLK